jgi:hypothetical protein
MILFKIADFGNQIVNNALFENNLKINQIT